MSTLLANRVQSSYPRSIHRPTTSVRATHIKQRPVTNVRARRSHTDVYNLPPTPSTPLRPRSIRQRPKTGHMNSTTNRHLSFEKLDCNDIECLLHSFERNNTFIVQVDSLANYGKLVQTINLRQTPLDYKSLCALQQHENRIIQQNACKDARFHTLLGVLEPLYVKKFQKK